MTEDLINLCDELEKSNYRRFGSNQIDFIRRKLKEYIGEDEDKLLGLKAQLRIQNTYIEKDLYQILPTFINTFSMCLLIIYNIVHELKPYIYNYYAIIILLVLSAYLLLYGYQSKKYKYRKSWIKYIEIVIENWENENK